MVSGAIALVILVKLVLIRLTNMDIKLFGLDSKEISYVLLLILTWILIINPLVMIPTTIRVVLATVLVLVYVIPQTTNRGVDNGNSI